MCGINLLIDKKSNLSEAPIQQMNLAIAYRGPDATHWLKFQNHLERIFIGHNRLKIIDTNNQSNQPFVSADGRYVLSYNGEIYNYKELRKKLEGKIDFKTCSDTEVLLYWLIKYGSDGISHLNGMFAFIFYDSLEKRFIIARDPSGITPLYYYEDENYFIASSEIKGIIHSGIVTKKFNEAQVNHYLKYKYARKPETFYKNIFELEEGSLIEYKNNESRKRTYVESQIAIKARENISEKEILSSTQELLRASVNRHLVADVTAGIFLSGGVDSTLLLSLIAETGTKNFPSFSIANSKSEKSFGTNDFHFAKLAAKQYGASHQQFEIDINILNYFPAFIESIDQPIADSASLLTWWLSKNVAPQIRVALSGAGADEVFAGYNRHSAYHNYLKYFKGNNTAITLFKNLAILPDGFAHPLRKYFKLLNKFAKQIDYDPVKTFINFCAQEGFQDLPVENCYTNHPDNCLSQALKTDKHQYLISDVLAMTDKMSMQHSLEVRLPFLDKEILAYIETIPAQSLLKHGKKWILKTLLNNRGGNIFTERPKEGFGMPIGPWLKRKEANFLLDYLSKENPLYEFVSYEKVLKIRNLHLAGKKDFSSELWSLIQLSAWMEKEFLTS